MRKIFRLRGNIEHSIYIGFAVASFIVLILVWSGLSYFEVVNPLFLPTPWEVIKKLVEMLQDSGFRYDILISIYRIVSGFLLASIIGIPIGFLVGLYKPIEGFIQPMAEFIRYMPVPCFVPLIIVWVGIGEEAKIGVVFLGIFFMTILMIADNVRGVSNDLINSAYTLGASSPQVILKVILPAAFPRVLDTLRIQFGGAWTYLTVAELVASSSGIGYTILKAQRYLQTANIFTGILVVGIMGLVSDRLFVFAGKKLFPWEESK